jgi:acetate---CoA ligase (ADP-forming)
MVTIAARADMTSVADSATGTNLDALFAPQSVAIVGVSSTGRGIGASTFQTLRRFGYDGDLAIVSRSMSEMDGVPSFPSLAEVPGPVDLVLMFTGADRVLATVEESIAIGARAGIVFASGFSEMGEGGIARQREVVGVAREAGFRILGPNCQGVVSYASRVAATFSNAIRGVEDLKPAPVAYVGQSGAIGGSIFDSGRERGCVPSVWVSTGNQADLDVVEISDYLLDQSEVDLLMLYLEQMPRGDAWEAMCVHAAAVDKRVVVLRSGTTPAGRIAVASHTGALVGADKAFNVVSSRHQVISVRDVHEVLDVALAHQAGLSTAGRRLAVVTTSGGAGGLAADAAGRAGLSVARLGTATQEALSTLLPQFASTQNPVDVTADLVSGDPHGLEEVCRLVAQDPNVDQVLVVISVVVGGAARALARALVKAVATSATPLTLAYIASRDRTGDVRQILSDGGVVVFDSISTAIVAAGRVCRSENRDEPEPDAPCGEQPPVTAWTETRGQAFLDQVGIDRPPGILAVTREEAERAGEALGPLVVLKVQSKDIVHKTDAGAVRVGVPSQQVGDAFDAVLDAVARHQPHAEIDGVLVQSMVKPGVELLVGVQIQQHGYPPLVTVGIGGTSVELYADTASRTLPIDVGGAVAMLEELRGSPLLNGYRGQAPCDIEAAAAAIVATGPLCDLLGDRLVEIEINPLIVHEVGAGATAVDFVAYLLDEAAPVVHGR